jgi:hypothetical protein
MNKDNAIIVMTILFLLIIFVISPTIVSQYYHPKSTQENITNSSSVFMLSANVDVLDIKRTNNKLYTLITNDTDLDALVIYEIQQGNIFHKFTLKRK